MPVRDAGSGEAWMRDFYLIYHSDAQDETAARAREDSEFVSKVTDIVTKGGCDGSLDLGQGELQQ
jgi:hypothetical protein